MLKQDKHSGELKAPLRLHHQYLHASKLAPLDAACICFTEQPSHIFSGLYKVLSGSGMQHTSLVHACILRLSYKLHHEDERAVVVLHQLLHQP